MKPITRIHSILFAISTTIVYSVWNWFASIQTNLVVLNLLISFLMSLTFYKALFQLLLFLCKQIPTLKKILLGKYFLEGVWIGFYTVDGETEYYYEIVEQNLDGITVKGIAFDEGQQSVGEWTIVDPTINIVESKLTYYYEMNVTSAGDITLGCSRATIYWDSRGYAYREVGFAVDNFSSGKQEYITVKIKTPKDLQVRVVNNFWNEVKILYHNERK